MSNVTVKAHIIQVHFKYDNRLKERNKDEFRYVNKFEMLNILLAEISYISVFISKAGARLRIYLYDENQTSVNVKNGFLFASLVFQSKRKKQGKQK
jgi:hypothetical protein